MNKKIIIAGGSGFLGRRLTHYLLEKGYEVLVLSRRAHTGLPDQPGKERLRFVIWDAKTLSGWEKELQGAEMVINLTGENIGSGRWSKKKKKKILDSRVNAALVLGKAIEKLEKKPGVYFQVSAVGFYGHGGEEELTETSPPGKGFLGRVVQEWESASEAIMRMGVRRVLMRSGIVLEKNQGVLPRMMLPFRFFLGGPLGGGRQWVPWVHIEDFVQAVVFLTLSKKHRGVFNLTAPGTVRNRDFSRILGRILKRPSFFPTPGFLLQAALGEKARQLLLYSQRVKPEKLLQAGFLFRFPELSAALADLLG